MPGVTDGVFPHWPRTRVHPNPTHVTPGPRSPTACLNLLLGLSVPLIPELKGGSPHGTGSGSTLPGGHGQLPLTPSCLSPCCRSRLPPSSFRTVLIGAEANFILALAVEDPSHFAACVSPQPAHAVRWSGRGWRRLVSPADVVLCFSVGALGEERGCGPAYGLVSGRATAPMAAEREASEQMLHLLPPRKPHMPSADQQVGGHRRTFWVIWCP